ncbi:MAG: hypothetical protein ACOX0F_01210 [Syntrophomonadaceae bacterium]|jgi:hypothetical protein
MDIVIRMKTGLFETTPFRLQTGENRLLLIPVTAEGAEPIVLDEKDILSITLTQRRLTELEIQTRDTLYSGLFEEGYPFEETVNCLKRHLNVNITCEYKGGEY